jgi:hypothetical protein
VVCKKVVPDGHKIMFRDTNSVNDWLTEWLTDWLIRWDILYGRKRLQY